MSILKWITFFVVVVVLWYFGKWIWEKVIQPYFREEVVDVRTSVQMDERRQAD